MTSEPIRLLDRADVPEGERSLLEEGRFGAPVDYDVAAGAARFRTQLAALAAAGAVASAGAGSSTAGGKTLLAKLAIKIVLGVAAGAAFSGIGVVAGMHLAASSSSQGALGRASPRVETATPMAPPVGSAPPNADSAPVPPMAQPPAPSLAPALEESPVLHRAPVRRAPSPELRHGAPASARISAALAPVPQSPAGELADEPTAPAPVAPPAEVSAPPVAPSAPPAAAPAQPPKLSEISAVALARDLVDRDPEAALALLARTQREHPTGYFVEERQALTVMALVRAGHQATARQQAAAFLRAYPNGPFSDRVRSVAGERIP